MWSSRCSKWQEQRQYCKFDTSDLQPETYCEIDRALVKFDEFGSFEKTVEKFKKSLCTFDTSNDPKDYFYNAILFDLVFKLSQNSVINKDIIIQMLGKEFFDNFQKKGKFWSLTFPLVPLKKKCYVGNEILTKKIIFTCLWAAQ